MVSCSLSISIFNIANTNKNTKHSVISASQVPSRNGCYSCRTCRNRFEEFKLIQGHTALKSPFVRSQSSRDNDKVPRQSLMSQPGGEDNSWTLISSKQLLWRIKNIHELLTEAHLAYGQYHCAIGNRDVFNK